MPYGSEWPINICVTCGAKVPMRQKREGTTCDDCHMKDLAAYRKRTVHDDEGVAYQG